jgi:hypothetical protein
VTKLRNTDMMYPALIPALPKPDMARPTIKVGEFGDTAQIREPTSNSATATRKTHLIEKNV